MYKLEMGFILAHVTLPQVYVLVLNTTIILDRIVGNARHTIVKQ